MTLTKKTHEVTQALLKFWITKTDGKFGVWVFDIPRQMIRFDAPPFSFAMENYLYIPKIEGERDQSVERWLSSAEGAMLQLIRRIEARTFENPIMGHDLAITLYGIISLAYRSGYQVKLLREKILSDEKLREHYEVTNPDEAHAAAVENMVNVIIQQAEGYLHGENSILFNLPNSLLLCESPFFDMAARDIKTAIGPITPQAAFMLDTRGGSKEPSLSFHEGNSQAAPICQSLNGFTIKRARKWIVATSREQLEQIKPQLTLEEVEKRKAKDHVTFIPPEEHGHKTWWGLKKPENE